MKQPFIVLTGPTAVGKTALSIRLAEAVGGEIVSTDSMQVYRHMGIDSAKVTPTEMNGVPHYLIDMLDPQEPFNAVTFQQMAKEVLREIHSRDRIPVTAGRTDFYIQALLYDTDFKENEGDNPVHRELEALAEREGGRAPRFLYSVLRQVGPKAAVQVYASNVKRITRAIKYFRQTGERISLHNQQEGKKRSPYNFFYYVLDTDWALLYERVDRRVDLIVEQGLVEEVRTSRDMGYRRDHTSVQGPGYKEILDYLEGRCSLEEAVYILKHDARHLAKRQLIWFEREREVRFLNLPEFGEDASKVLERILEDYAKRGIVLQ